MSVENDLGKDNIRRLVWRIAFPSMLAQFVSVLYSIVDRMYIGNIPQIGDVALAGVGVCGPVVTMVGSVAFLVGIGGSPLMSRRMGEGRMEEARKILSNAFVLLLGLALILTAAMIAIRRPMLMLFGASEMTYPYADIYFTTYLSGTVFALLSNGNEPVYYCPGIRKGRDDVCDPGGGLKYYFRSYIYFCPGYERMRGCGSDSPFPNGQLYICPCLFVWKKGAGKDHLWRL